MNPLAASPLWRALLDLVFPPRCVGCRRAGARLCEGCLAGVVHFGGARCPRCDLPFAHSRSPLCARCARGELHALDGMRVVGPHDTPLREAIHALKYERRTELAAPLGALLAAHWQHHAPGPVDGVLPVPLHPARQRERGFNQSALLAEHVAAALNLPLHPAWLQRVRATRPQVGLGRGERQGNVADAFLASPDVAGGYWLLVDDVCTTGATLEASAHALRAQGAATVWALTLARPLTA